MAMTYTQKLEAVLRVVGLALIVLAIGFVDWRAGLFAAGLALIASTVDYRRAA